MVKSCWSHPKKVDIIMPWGFNDPSSLFTAHGLYKWKHILTSHIRRFSNGGKHYPCSSKIEKFQKFHRSYLNPRLQDRRQLYILEKLDHYFIITLLIRFRRIMCKEFPPQQVFHQHHNYKIKSQVVLETSYLLAFQEDILVSVYQKGCYTAWV